MMHCGGMPHVLIDGLITYHKVIPSNEPGRSTLRVIGQDISVKLSFEDRNKTYRQQKDSDIVYSILSDADFTPQVRDTTETAEEGGRIPWEQCENLNFVRQLAQRNGFVFYVEPTNAPGVNIAYWGPENRQGEHQPALSMNMGPQTNVDTPINFHFNALAPSEPEISIIDPFTKLAIQVPLPTSFLPALTSNPAPALRKVFSRDSANLSLAQAILQTLTSASATADTIEANGEADAARYGQALRAPRLVDVRGAGQSYDGTYYVRQVIHDIKIRPRGDYKQRFTITRDGRGSLSTSITPALF